MEELYLRAVEETQTRFFSEHDTRIRFDKEHNNYYLKLNAGAKKGYTAENISE